MDQRPLGKTDINISPIVMGAWQAGKAMWVGIDDKETERAMRAGIDVGVTTIDTARAYGDGHSERIVGRATKGVRERVVIATKVFVDSLAYDQVKKSCHESLNALGTDYIDLYQIHWPSGSFASPMVPIAETMEALNELKADEKIRAIGVSNFSRAQISAALKFGQIACLQGPYSLFWRQMESDIMTFCVENGISVLAYSPLGQGLLTGKFTVGHTFEKGDHRQDNRLFQPEHFERACDAIEQLKPIAERHAVTLGQLALAWVLHQSDACAIAGARNAEQTVQNAGSTEITLSSSDLSDMDQISRIVTDHLDDDPVLWKL